MSDPTKKPGAQNPLGAVTSGCIVSHYVYFSKKSNADQAAIAFREEGYKTTERMGADGTNWLVLVEHAIDMTESAVDDAMKKVAKQARHAKGEYDGWEIAQ